jgi:Leucine-rich repeat (LRR) protein
VERLPTPDCNIYRKICKGFPYSAISLSILASNMPNLQNLLLVGNRFTDAGLQHLPPNLQNLLLDGEEFTDVGLQRLPQDLQELSLLSAVY